MGFLIKFHIVLEKSTNPTEWARPLKLVPILFHKMGTFSIRFPYCGILHHMRNEWVLSSISHCMGKDRKAHLMKKAWEIGFRENPVKPIVCGEPGKLVLIFFP